MQQYKWASLLFLSILAVKAPAQPVAASAGTAGQEDLARLLGPSGLEHQWKLSPSFLQKLSQGGQAEQLFLLKANRLDIFRDKLSAKGLSRAVQQEYEPTGLVLLRMSGRELANLLLPDEEVVFVDIRDGLPREERAVRNFDLSANQVNAVHQRYPDLNGEGLAVSVKEYQLDSTDIDLAGRYLPSGLSAPAISTHATIMATMIAGGGNTFYTGKGVAWKAKLSSSSFLNLFPDPASYFSTNNLSVQNHSYGLGIENYYGGEAQAYDEQVYRKPDLVHVFSSGNIGDSTSAAGPYLGVKGFANLSGNFKMAKNVLAVGALDSTLAVASRSSRGPAFDGRVKPELVALGEDGSSGAAALASGVALLIQQAYRELYGGMSAAALVRAALLNSADDVGTPGPDYFAGYGNVNALKAVNTIKEGRFFSGALEQGVSESFTIQLPDNAVNLKATLAWTDPPAPVNAARALANDLDLLLVHENANERWLPWALSTFPSADSLSLPARRQADHLNNQEQVTVANPAAGAYRIEVSASEMQQGPQEFFLAFEWDTLGHFEWLFPTAGDNARAGEKMPVRWAGTLGTGTGALEFSLLGSQEWVAIHEDVNLASAFGYWDVPDTFALAQLRMRQGGRDFYSDTFTVSRPMELELGLECGDSLLLFWNAAAAIDSFQLFTLEGNYLEAISITQDSFAVFNKSDFPSRYFAVAPIIQPAYPGVKSYTLNLDFQSPACYIQSFLAGLEGESARLLLSLGTLHQIGSLAFEKWQDGVFLPIAAFAPVGGLAIEYLDGGLRPGNNTYRAVVTLKNGQKIYSEEAAVFYLAQPFLIFPNPAVSGQDIQLYSKAVDGAALYLYDALGRLALREELLSNFESIATGNLARGAYYYLILKGKERLGEGVILLR